jgi:hypothetical protein
MVSLALVVVYCWWTQQYTRWGRGLLHLKHTVYFIDVKEAKNGKKYLAITENRLDSADRKERATIRVFAESIEQFRQAISEAATVAQ